MTYLLVPFFVTLIAVAELWRQYASDRTQESFDVAATSTVTCLLATAATSFALWLTH